MAGQDTIAHSCTYRKKCEKMFGLTQINSPQQNQHHSRSPIFARRQDRLLANRPANLVARLSVQKYLEVGAACPIGGGALLPAVSAGIKLRSAQRESVFVQHARLAQTRCCRQEAGIQAAPPANSHEDGKRGSV
jgi:hypothetical protein